MSKYDIGAFGSSITAPTNSWASITRGLIASANSNLYTKYTSQAVGGNWPYSNLVRYPDELQKTQPIELFLTDYRIVTALDYKALEALTRRIFTDNPRAIIVSPIIPVDANLDGAVDDQIQSELDSATLATQYGVHLVDYRQAVIDLVAGGALLTDYIQDTIHPTNAGCELCGQMVYDAIVANSWLTPENHSSLPARLYDDGSYENEPVRINGTENTSKTGTWTETGTRIESSEVNATITFTATCQSYGVYRSDNLDNNNVSVSVDSGAYSELLVNRNGVAIVAGRAEHTITIKVLSGTVIIDEFWAV